MSAIHCSFLRLAPGTGWRSSAGVRHCFSWETGSFGVQCRQHGAGEEKEKVVTTPGTATLLLAVQACFSVLLVFKKISPGSHCQKRGDSKGLTSARFARCFLSRE